MSLKEKFNIHLDYVHEEDIIEIKDDRYGDTYRYTRPIEMPDKPGFLLVPGMVRFAYRHKGEVYDMKHDRIIPAKEIVQESASSELIRVMKFVLFNNWPKLKPEERPRHIGSVVSEHRLMMMIHTEYDVHPKNMRIRFRNGNHRDLRLDNLYWESKAISVMAVNMVTGERILYKSHATAAKDYGLGGGAVHNHCRKKAVVPTREGILFRNVDEADDVPVFSELQKRWICHPGRNPITLSGCQILNIQNKEVFFGNYNQAAEYLGVSRGVFNQWIRRGYGGDHIIKKCSFLDESVN